MARTKIEKKYTFQALGFPVVLSNAPMVRVRGEWVLDVDLNKLMRAVAMVLAKQRAPLTGAQVRYLRHRYEMTTTAFAEKFGVTHPAVLKWESSGEHPTKMALTTELVLRMFVLDQEGIVGEEFHSAFQKAEIRQGASVKPVRVEARAVSAAMHG